MTGLRSIEGTPQPIHAALVEAMRQIGSIQKADRTGEKDGQRDESYRGPKFNFRGIDSVLNAVGPVFRDVGIVVIPTVTSATYEDVEVGRDRTRMRQATVTVEYRFYGPAGDSLTAITVGEAMDSGDKAVSKAMSVAMRTALLQTLCVPTGDPDPDTYHYDRSSAPAVTDEQQQADRNLVAREIMAIADSIPLTFEEVAADYNSWSLGGYIKDANTESLSQYLAYLREEARPHGQTASTPPGPDQNAEQAPNDGGGAGKS